MLADLAALSREIGHSDRDLVVLAEGNTSAKLPDGTFLVKASGFRLELAEESAFVRMRLEPLIAAVLASGVCDVDSVFRSAQVNADGPRASIETFLHAVALGLGGATWVVHTHPTVVTGLLCSKLGRDLLLSGPIFPDEAVVCGSPPLYVPYAEPGLHLARAVAHELERFMDAHGRPPLVVYLENHGLVALGASAMEAIAVTTMAVKAARVRLVAFNAGGLHQLDAASISAVVNRQDEIERRAHLVENPTAQAKEAR
jgi:rhamnose utilization protein RhaD (predicted bifunctional aldolase and dehydrogenase)